MKKTEIKVISIINLNQIHTIKTAKLLVFVSSNEKVVLSVSGLCTLSTIPKILKLSKRLSH
jgi:hypothetical protein